eukprot:685285-Alexandrium_andersonii.AAC.1
MPWIRTSVQFLPGAQRQGMPPTNAPPEAIASDPSPRRPTTREPSIPQTAHPLNALPPPWVHTGPGSVIATKIPFRTMRM